MLFKKLKCSGPPSHRNRTDDWWLLGNKRSARHIGREKTGDAKRFHFLLIIPLVSGWFRQNGKHPMTVWGSGEVKLTTELGTELTVKKSKSRITLLCPITPDAVHLGPITHHAGVPSRVTETPFTTLIFHMRCVANRHDRGHDRDLLGRGREFPSTK